MKIFQNPALYGALAAGLSYLPAFGVKSQVISVIFCAALYGFVNKKIMPPRQIFGFAGVFAVISMLASTGVLWYQVLREITVNFSEHFLQILIIMPVAFIISAFIFYPANLITYGVLVLFQGKHQH